MRYLAARLVELNLAIEDLNAWATDAGDVAELRRLEELRDSVQAVLEGHDDHGDALRRLIDEQAARVSPRTTVDPRD